MGNKTIIVGAGIIGASIAFNLAKAGRTVVILDAGEVGGAASGRSFGWINASFYRDASHHKLRAASMHSYRQLCREIKSRAVDWCGALLWEVQGAALDKLAAELEAFDYPLNRLDHKDLARRCPSLTIGNAELLEFPHEGVADLAQLTRDLINAAIGLGARLITGARVEKLALVSGRITGVYVDKALIEGDEVIIAAGVQCQEILKQVDVTLPMLPRPGLLMTTKPVARCIDQVMVAPLGEFKQCADGRIIAPTVANHQADESANINDDPIDLAQGTLEKLRAILPELDLELESISIGYRPMPSDGLPAIGYVGPDGLYVATMHSGATLAAGVGEWVTQELCGGVRNDLLIPYEPTRFDALS